MAWLAIGIGVAAIAWLAILYPMTTVDVLEVVLMLTLLLGLIPVGVAAIVRIKPSNPECSRNTNLMIQGGWFTACLMQGITLYLHYGGGAYADPRGDLEMYLSLIIIYAVGMGVITGLDMLVAIISAIVIAVAPKQPVFKKKVTQRRPVSEFRMPDKVVDGLEAVGSFFSDWYNGVCPHLNELSVCSD
jgi:hypothetical protein